MDNVKLLGCKFERGINMHQSERRGNNRRRASTIQIWPGTFVAAEAFLSGDESI